MDFYEQSSQFSLPPPPPIMSELPPPPSSSSMSDLPLPMLDISTLPPPMFDNNNNSSGTNSEGIDPSSLPLPPPSSMVDLPPIPSGWNECDGTELIPEIDPSVRLNAITVIQSSWRAFRERRQYKLFLKAVVIVQKVYRGFLARKLYKKLYEESRWLRETPPPTGPALQIIKKARGAGGRSRPTRGHKVATKEIENCTNNNNNDENNNNTDENGEGGGEGNESSSTDKPKLVMMGTGMVIPKFDPSSIMLKRAPKEGRHSIASFDSLSIKSKSAENEGGSSSEPNSPFALRKTVNRPPIQQQPPPDSSPISSFSPSNLRKTAVINSSLPPINDHDSPSKLPPFVLKKAPSTNQLSSSEGLPPPPPSLSSFGDFPPPPPPPLSFTSFGDFPPPPPSISDLPPPINFNTKPPIQPPPPIPKQMSQSNLPPPPPINFNTKPPTISATDIPLPSIDLPPIRLPPSLPYHVSSPNLPTPPPPSFNAKTVSPNFPPPRLATDNVPPPPRVQNDNHNLPPPPQIVNLPPINFNNSNLPPPQTSSSMGIPNNLPSPINLPPPITTNQPQPNLYNKPPPKLPSQSNLPLPNNLPPPITATKILKPGWEVFTTQEGKKYYCNRSQNLTTWNENDAYDTTVSTQSPSLPPPPPPSPSSNDWEELMTKDGKKYYYNRATNVTKWDKPISNPTSEISNSQSHLPNQSLNQSPVQQSQQQKTQTSSTSTSSSSSSKKKEHHKEIVSQNPEEKKRIGGILSLFLKKRPNKTDLVSKNILVDDGTTASTSSSSSSSSSKSSKSKSKKK
ncbi:hypothetical protein ACTFIY_006588 [Dictyostelium cf. discoideum]